MLPRLDAPQTARRNRRAQDGRRQQRLDGSMGWSDGMYSQLTSKQQGGRCQEVMGLASSWRGKGSQVKDCITHTNRQQDTSARAHTAMPCPTNHPQRVAYSNANRTTYNEGQQGGRRQGGGKGGSAQLHTCKNGNIELSSSTAVTAQPHKRVARVATLVG